MYTMGFLIIVIILSYCILEWLIPQTNINRPGLATERLLLASYCLRF